MTFSRLPVLLVFILFSGTAPADIGENIPSGNALDFTITRNGDVIGAHHVRFMRNGDDVTVRTDINIRVTFAFITLYDYQHEATEVWRGGVLHSIEAKTNNDGTPEFVSLRREGGRLVGNSTRGKLGLPDDIGATSYWNSAYLDVGTWLDTQDGEVLQMRHQQKGEEEVTVRGQTVTARKSHSLADNGSEVSLWYAADQLVKMQFRAFDGSILDYDLL